MASNKFCFPPHEGLPDLSDPSRWGLPPTLNGYIEPDLAVTTPELETGWTRSGRITYAGDTGLPQMVFQGLKHNTDNYLYLSFMVRFDTAFDTNDRIILVFHPTAPTGAGTLRSNDHRRIDIRPLTQNIGAGTAGDSADSDDLITADGVPFRVRTNRREQGITYYKFNSANSIWNSTPAINNITIRVRSWEPAISGPGTTNNHNWSVEIKLPTRKALAAHSSDPSGDNWIDFTNNFGFYFNVIRLCSGCASSLGTASNSQYAWPPADYMTGRGLIVDGPGGPIAIEQHLTTGADGAPTAEANWPDWLGEGVIGGGIGSCRGVRFANGVNSIGIINPANPLGPLGARVNAAAGVTNTFGARITNDDTNPADQVKATFRIARWGVGPGSHTQWPMIPATINGLPAPAPDNRNPTDTVNLTAFGTPGASAELRTKWGLNAAERSDFAGFGGDRCLWVLLDSGASVNFTESSVRRNLSFINLSAQEIPAAISGKWEPVPADGQHNFLLLVSQRLIVSTSYDRLKTGKSQTRLAADGERRVTPEDIEKTISWLEAEILRKYRLEDSRETRSTWLVINNAYRETNYTLTLDGIQHRLFEPAGSFGYVAEHIGEVREWKYKISGGPELTTLSEAEGAYSIRVPHNGEVVIKTHLEAVEQQQLWSNSCLTMILWPFLLITKVIRKLLGLP